MKSNLAVKLVAIAAISMVLIFVLQMIEFKVDERDRYRSQAKVAISQGWSGSQLIVAPILRLTLKTEYTEEVFDKNLKIYITKNRSKTWTELHLPEQLSINGKVNIQERYKGIYRIPVYETDINFSGQFPALKLSKGNIIRAELISSFSDMRGISNTPKLDWNDKNVLFQSGRDTQLLGNYISADITTLFNNGVSKFSMQTKLRGLDNISFVPSAKQVSVSLQSDWKHPYFIGRYLPDARTVGESGFKAQWNMTEFATSIQRAIGTCQQTQDQCYVTLHDNSFGVGLHNPIDVYQKTDRSLKYGFLFIMLTFVVFCLFEALKQVQIHSIQYALVGAALAIFYLLLISISEHLSFGLAYLIATLSCVGLIWFYLLYVFKNQRHAASVSLGMFALYGMLYMILKSEDFALLMGSMLTFLSLGTLMIVTRNIDWYSLSTSSETDSDDTQNLQMNTGAE